MDTLFQFKTADTDHDTRIRTAQAIALGRMKANPDMARSIAATTGMISDGLACHIRQGKFTLVSDLGRGMGGDATGPSPSFFARAAIASCVAMAIKMHAANEAKAFRQVEVTVETDMCDLALFGIGNVSAAPLRTDISIVIKSDEEPDVVAAIVDTALGRDPWYLALRDSQAVVTTLAQTRTDGCSPSATRRKATARSKEQPKCQPAAESS